VCILLKNKISWDEIEDSLRSYLGLKYHLVGINLLKSEDKRNYKGIRKPNRQIAFCHAIREIASNGGSLIYGINEEACPIAQIALGFTRLPIKVSDEMTQFKIRANQVLISSLNEIREDPDVIVAILNPKQMMTLAVIIHTETGFSLSVEFKGERACFEFFTRPYIESKPNISLLCHGARTVYSDFRDDEFIFGAPPKIYFQAYEIVDMLRRIGGSLCGCQTSDIPESIIREFEEIGFSKGTDYFFGKINGYSVRVYLNKDLQGRLKFITLHLIIKSASETEAEDLVNRLKKLFQHITV